MTDPYITTSMGFSSLERRSSNIKDLSISVVYRFGTEMLEISTLDHIVYIHSDDVVGIDIYILEDEILSSTIWGTGSQEVKKYTKLVFKCEKYAGNVQCNFHGDVMKNLKDLIASLDIAKKNK